MSASRPRTELEQPRLSFVEAHAEGGVVRRHAPVFGRRYSA